MYTYVYTYTYTYILHIQYTHAYIDVKTASLDTYIHDNRSLDVKTAYTIYTLYM